MILYVNGDSHTAAAEAVSSTAFDYIYVNGDSYSQAQSFKVYSDFLGQDLECPVINDSTAGSCNDRILRSSLNHLLTTDKKPLVIIGWSFITREEVWVDNIAPYQHRIKDYSGSRLVTSDWIAKKQLSPNELDTIIDQNINKQVVQFYTKLLLFANFLDKMSMPYLMFSAADNRDWRKLDIGSLNRIPLYQHIVTNSRILPFDSFCFRTFAEQNQLEMLKTYHLLEPGHRTFSKYLYDIIRQR